MAAPRPSDVLDHVDEQDEVITGEAVALQLPAHQLRAASGRLGHRLRRVLRGVHRHLDRLLLRCRFLGMDPALAQAIQIVGTVVALVVVPMTVELATQGKSLGRLAVGARIVRDDGGAVGFRHSFIRRSSG